MNQRLVRVYCERVACPKQGRQVIGEVEAGARYALHCKECRHYSEGVAGQGTRLVYRAADRAQVSQFV